MAKRKKRGLETVRDHLRQMLLAAGGLVAGGAAEAISPGAALPAAATFSLFSGLIRALGMRKAREEFDEVWKRLGSIEGRIVDFEFLYSEEFISDLRIFLELAAREKHAEKVTAARNHLLRKACDGPLDDSSDDFNQFMDRMLEDATVLHLRILFALRHAPRPANEDHPELHTIDELAREVATSAELVDSALFDLAVKRVVHEFNVRRPSVSQRGGIMGGQHRCGLSDFGLRVRDRLADITNEEKNTGPVLPKS